MDIEGTLGKKNNDEFFNFNSYFDLTIPIRSSDLDMNRPD